jgi:hypothetical protein
MWRILTIVILMCAASCARVAVNQYDAYAIVPMDISECSPEKGEIASSKTIVSVPKFDDSELEERIAKELSKRANLPSVMSSKVASLLAEAGIEHYSAEDRQRKPVKDLAAKKEILTKAEPGIVMANYVVVGSLHAVEVTSTYEEQHEGREYGVAGKKVRIGPKCRHTATVKGSIRIFDNERRELGSIDLSGSRFLLEDAKGKQCPTTSNIVTMVRESAEFSIREAKTKLQNFCPPVGYVLEKRSNSKESIYKISIGSNMGVRPGTEVHLLRKYKFTNPLTEKTVVESRVVTTGKVTDQLGSNYSWVRTGEDVSLQLGDIAKVVYSDSMLYQLGVGR